MIVIGFFSFMWKRVINSQLDARSLLEKTEAHLFKALGLAEAVVGKRICGPAYSPRLPICPRFWGRARNFPIIRSTFGSASCIRSTFRGCRPYGASTLMQGRYSTWSFVSRFWTADLAGHVWVGTTETDDIGQPVRAVGLLQNIDKRNCMMRYRSVSA